MQYIVLDTNIILNNAHNIFTFPDNTTIVIPETVVDELDSKKSVIGEIGFQAREFGRLLARATKLPLERTSALTIAKFELDGVQIHLTSTSNYPNYSDTSPSVINDRKIIEIAKQYQAIYLDVVFYSIDVMCRTRAESEGLLTSDFKEVERTEYEFVKTISLDFDTFSNVHNKPILTIDPDYKPENYSYVFISPDTNQHKLANIYNGNIDVLGKVTETELRSQDISPSNIGQLFLSRAIQDPTGDIVVVESLAGSGKTLVSLSNAIKLVKTNTPYESIIYIRNSVDDIGAKDEEIGFLSGNDEKLGVYLHPLQDSIDAIIRAKYNNSKLKGAELEAYLNEQRQKLTTDCKIQGMIAIGTRGRTFTNSIVIIDEAQNISKATMVKLLTRIGKNCKVIILGSLRQIDSAYLTKYTSGLTTILNACTYTHEEVKIVGVTLDKVVRGKITAFAEQIFSTSPTPKGKIKG